MKQKVISAFNFAMNNFLQLDNKNKDLLKELSGACYQVQLTDLKLNIYLVFYEQGVSVLAEQPQQKVDVTLKGSSINLIGAGQMPERIEIIGDLNQAKRLKNLLSQIELPVSKLIASKLGGDFAYFYDNFILGASNFADSIADDCKQNLHSYVNDELGVLVGESEFKLLKKKVASLRNKLTTLEKKYEDISG